MRRAIGWIVLVLLVATGVMAQPAVAMQLPTKDQCSVDNAAAATVAATAPDKRAKGHAKRSKHPAKPAQVKLTPEPNSQSRVINFGDDRDEEFQRYTLVADRALPAGAEKRVSLVADVMTRTGAATAETVTFPDPKFTPIQVYGNRKRLTFGVCLRPPKSLPAGNYTGLITTDAPRGIEDTTVTVTANAKDGPGFKLGAALTLALAFAVLLYKGAADTRAKRIEAAKNQDDAAKKSAANWRASAWDQFTDFGWFASTAAALAATFLVLYALWEKDPAWGESGIVASGAALITAGLAAVGAKTVITPSGNSPPS